MIGYLPGREQLEGYGELTPSCDVYGLGKTLEAMLGEGVQFRQNCLLGGKTALRPQNFRRRKHLMGRQGRIAESMAGRKKRKQIVRFLDACTRREAAERIPDMEQARLLLGQFAVKKER